MSPTPETPYYEIAKTHLTNSSPTQAILAMRAEGLDDGTITYALRIALNHTLSAQFEDARTISPDIQEAIAAAFNEADAPTKTQQPN